MGDLDKLIDNMRELELNEIFKVRLLDRRNSKERSFILRTNFYWDTKDYKIFKSVIKHVIWNNHGFTKENRDKLNQALICQLNNTIEI